MALVIFLSPSVSYYSVKNFCFAILLLISLCRVMELLTLKSR